MNDAGMLLMMFRRGKWDLPKGKLDDGEQIEDCALREVKEETGVKRLRIIKFLGITYHEYFDPHLKEDVIKETHWFRMLAKGKQKLVPQYDEDIEKIEWVDEESLPEKLNNSYPNIIDIIRRLKT